MKKLQLLIAIAITTTLYSCHKDDNTAPAPSSKNVYTQDIPYTDNNQIIYNPDMGFYNSKTVTVTTNGVENLESVLKKITTPSGRYSGTYNKNDKFDLLLLEFDISAYSSLNNGKEIKLTNQALTDIALILETFKGTNKTAILQFAYDPGFSGKKTTNSKGEEVFADVEPKNFDLILQHITQIVTTVKPYQQYITAIKCGMIGPYGEGHSTTYGGDKDGKPCGYLVEVMNQFANEMQAQGVEIPLLMRQPKFMYNYFGYTGKEDYKTNIPDVSGKNYIFGFYNGGYLGTDTDLGTYRNKDSRADEIKYISYFTNHTPYGGEITRSSDKSRIPLWQSDLEGSIKEMFLVHLSFLNIGYKVEALEALNQAEYNNETAFLYIFKHLGYRYVITNAEISTQNNNTNIKIEYINNGFANMPFHRKKQIFILLKTENNITTIDTKQFFINAPSNTQQPSTLTITIPNLQIPNTPCTVYLKISDSDGSYPIQFANNIWNNDLQANKIGKLNEKVE